MSCSSHYVLPMLLYLPVCTEIFSIYVAFLRLAPLLSYSSWRSRLCCSGYDSIWLLYWTGFSDCIAHILCLFHGFRSPFFVLISGLPWLQVSFLLYLTSRGLRNILKRALLSDRSHNPELNKNGLYRKAGVGKSHAITISHTQPPCVQLVIAYNIVPYSSTSCSHWSTLHVYKYGMGQPQ